MGTPGARGLRGAGAAGAGRTNQEERCCVRSVAKNCCAARQACCTVLLHRQAVEDATYRFKKKPIVACGGRAGRARVGRRARRAASWCGRRGDWGNKGRMVGGRASAPTHRYQKLCCVLCPLDTVPPGPKGKCKPSDPDDGRAFLITPTTQPGMLPPSLGVRAAWVRLARARRVVRAPCGWGWGVARGCAPRGGHGRCTKAAALTVPGWSPTPVLREPDEA